MLNGKGVLAIWNDIADGGRQLFYEWHIREHIPERLSIPGFLVGRRYRAVDDRTSPEFFTLYEVESFDILCSDEYRARLNRPTELTRKATSYFRNTSRALSKVIASEGFGPGGILATLRSNAEPSTLMDGLRTQIMLLSTQPLITGVHLCTVNIGTSRIKTRESAQRTDIGEPPAWFLLIEACTPDAIADLLDRALTVEAEVELGTYSLEHVQHRSRNI